MNEHLQEIYKEANHIASQWNGKTTNGEEKAMVAIKIAQKCLEMQKLIDELNNFN